MEASKPISMYAFYLPANKIRNSQFWEYNNSILALPLMHSSLLVRSPGDTLREPGQHTPAADFHYPLANGAPVPAVLPYVGDRTHTEQTCCRHATQAN